MRDIVRKINSVTVKVILFFFYFLAIGTSFLVYSVFFSRRSRQEKTYWEKSKEKTDFESAF